MLDQATAEMKDPTQVVVLELESQLSFHVNMLESQLRCREQGIMVDQ